MNNTTTKEQGIDQVIDSHTDDALRLFNFAKEWIKTRRTQFTAEDIKVAYLASNDPIYHNLYGAVFSKLAKAELITHKGFTTAKLQKAHGRSLRTWVRAIQNSCHVEPLGLFA